MTYNLVYLALRKTAKFPTKGILHPELFLPRRLPPKLYRFIQTEDWKNCKKPSDGEGSKSPKLPNIPNIPKIPTKLPKSTFKGSGKELVEKIISEAQKGKIPKDEIISLVSKVMEEGNLQEYSKGPQMHQHVGFAGLLPMVGLPVLSLLSASSGLAHMHLAYGATVLSFLGGSMFYESIINNEVSHMKMAWVITPQLLGWFSLLLPVPLGILVTSYGFCVALVHDLFLSKYPPWLKSLRYILTLGTLASFALMFVVSIIF